ncbi:Rad17-domain-containing protein [Macroventuria anomochaeta]|uniref:Rad17-domain-containing protein n=1 Tax=Macroventuria anomochaeta TaxID=301207 RepID=A0ACB6S0V5_9PLEO|nr:Rad17-domain-containing protein [Macroventuria anomochaeta]KAF2627920.1 Rad17-domain-containing protein [Macroventuria anomochaeta]
MVKPRAARKQPIVLSSDTEGSSPPPPKRPKRGTLASSSTDVQGSSKARATRVQKRLAVSPKLSSIASTQKSPTKSPRKLKPIHKPITSFFLPGTTPHSQSVQPTPTSSPGKRATPLEDVDDILESSDDDRRSQPPTALPVRKRKSVTALAASDAGNGSKGSQKFLRTASGARGTPPPSQPARKEPADGRPWTEKYGPLSLDELAVHRKKVSDVRTWLEDVYSGKQRKRLLLLKGPAGSGKTTAIALLSKELGIHMHEWKNPASSMTASEGIVSATAQFDDFVGRAGAFGSLTFDGPHQTPPQVVSSTDSRQNQLVLVEEFPNTFARASPAVQSFRSSVLNFLAATTPSATTFFARQAGPEHSITPIVMIISETLLSTNTAAADSFTAHRLLGPEILTHPGLSVIDFNPIAPTYMTKALDLVVVKEARKSGRRNTAGPQVIQRLAELGDVRSAVSSLEFLCLRGDESEGWGAKVNFSKKKGPKDVPITKMERESLELVTQRESTLGIFHAVGRVVYNKRLPEDPNNPVPQPPHLFPERRRPKASEVNLDTLIDELGTDTHTFTAALHENYVLSCGGADSEETMDSVDGCIEALSDADLLSPDRFGAGSGRRNLQGTSADNLRQDEMCFQTSVRGLLYNLPHSVKRMAPPPGVMGIKAKGQGASTGAAKSGSAFVMYYPASLRIWKQQEETNDLLELWISRAQRGELLSTSSGPFKHALPTGGVETWKRNTAPLQTSSTSSTASSRQGNDEPLPTLLGSGGSARYEMLLERLPYLTTILRKSRMPSPSTAATIREIQKITSFHGTGSSKGGYEEDGEDTLEQQGGEQEQWATDKDTPATPRKKKGVRLVESKEKDEEESAIAGLSAKGASLVLEDDDIED